MIENHFVGGSHNMKLLWNSTYEIVSSSIGQIKEYNDKVFWWRKNQ